MNQSFVQIPHTSEASVPAVGQRPYVAAPQAAPAPPSGRTLSEVFNAIWRRKWLLLLSNLALCAIAFGVIRSLPPQYTADARVMIDPRRQLAAEADPALASLRLSPETMETLVSEVQVIKSTDVLEDALDQAGLDTTAQGVPEHAMLCGLAYWLLEAFSPGACASSGPADRVAEIESLREDLDIKQVDLSRVVSIAYSHPDPKRAALVANAIADAYVDHQSKARADINQDSKKWLGDRIPAVRGELEQAREALEKQRTQEALVDGRDADLLRNQIAGLGLGISDLRAEHQALQSRIGRAKALMSEKGPAGVFEVVGVPTVAEEQQLALSGLLQQRRERARELGDRHPEMVALGQQIEAARGELASTAASSFSAMASEGELAAQRLAAAEDQLAELRRDLSSIAGAEIRLSSLEQEANSKQATLDLLLQRAQQFSEFGYDRPVAWMVSPAEPPIEPAAPNKRLLFVVAAVAGAGLTLGLVLLLELREQRYAMSLDVLRKLPNVEGLAILPASPSLRWVKEPPADGDQQAAGIYLEAMRRVYGSLVRPGPTPPRIVLVSSAEPSEGKTTFAAWLGRTAARRGRRVLVIDCDFVRPALHRMFQLRNEGGFSDYFRSRRTIRPLGIRGEGGLDILTVGDDPANARKHFFGHDIPGFLTNLTVHYDLIILDSPPVLAVADAKLLAPYADSVVMIVKWRATSMAAVRAALDELQESRSEPIKVALNQVDLGHYASYSYNSYPAQAALYSYARYFASGR